jgi:hypothetical protein
VTVQPRPEKIFDWEDTRPYNHFSKISRQHRKAFTPFNGRQDNFDGGLARPRGEGGAARPVVLTPSAGKTLHGQTRAPDSEIALSFRTSEPYSFCVDNSAVSDNKYQCKDMQKP